MRKTLRQKLTRQENGITLIALVITIIVLLILSGVSIMMLTGDNSILNQATNAKKSTIEGQEKEAITLAYNGALANTYGAGVTATDLQQELRKNGNNIEDIETVEEGMKVTFTDTHNVYIVGNNGNVNEYTPPPPPAKIADKKTPSGQPVQALSTTGTTTLLDDDNNEVKVPQGFGIASDSETKITKGVVIEDVSYTDTAGSQYVWIPVFEYDEEKCPWGANYSEVKKQTEDSDKYYEEIETALKNYTATYKNASYTDVWYGDESFGEYGYFDPSDTEKTNLIYYTNGNMTSDEYKTLYRGMLKSVYQNGGFYIGRYEMGTQVVTSTTEAQNATRVALIEYTSTNTNENNTAPSIEGMSKPLSRANTVAYTYITQSQAEMLAESLNYTGVTSSLLFGVQWDAVCVYLEHYGVIDESATQSAKEKFNTSYLNNNTYSKLWGNYKNATFKMDRGYYSTTYNTTAVTWNEKRTTAKGKTTSWLCTTGASDQNQACKIYDFAGNLSEWTLERIINARNPCSVRGSNFNLTDYASNRRNSSTYYSGYSFSARSSLYIK